MRFNKNDTLDDKHQHTIFMGLLSDEISEGKKREEKSISKFT